MSQLPYRTLPQPGEVFEVRYPLEAEPMKRNGMDAPSLALGIVIGLLLTLLASSAGWFVGAR